VLGRNPRDQRKPIAIVFDGFALAQIAQGDEHVVARIELKNQDNLYFNHIS